jgi:hypothetical protein
VAELGRLFDQAVPVDRCQFGLNAEGIVAVGAVAVELLAQAVMGQLEGIFAVALQGLQVELALQVDLIVEQPGLLYQGQEQGQQLAGVGRGALEADQQAVFGGFAAQARAQALHLVGQGVTAVVAAAAAEQARQQLVAAPLADRVGAAAAADPEFGRHDLRPRAPHHPEGAAAGQHGGGPGTSQGSLVRGLPGCLRGSGRRWPGPGRWCQGRSARRSAGPLDGRRGWGSRGSCR